MKTKLFYFICIVITMQLRSLYIDAQCVNPNWNSKPRALYIDDFLRFDLTGLPYTPDLFSILGNTTKENDVLNYAYTQNCQVIYLYDLERVFDNLANHLQGISTNPTIGQVFNNFMIRARNTYNIHQIGAVIGDNKQYLNDIVYFEGSRPYWCSGQEVPSTGSEVETTIHDIDNDIASMESNKFTCINLRNTKLLYQVYAYNNFGLTDDFSALNYVHPHFGTCDDNGAHLYPSDQPHIA